MTEVTDERVYSMIIGRTISELRERHGFSQVALANLVALTQPTLSRIERGGTQPDPFTLRKMAMAFKMTLPALLEQVEDAYARAQKQAQQNAPKASGEDSWGALAALSAFGVISLVGFAVAASLADQNSSKHRQESKVPPPPPPSQAKSTRPKE